MANDAVIRIRVDDNGAIAGMDNLARATKRGEDATRSYARAAKESESAVRAQQRAVEQSSKAFESAGKSALAFGLGMAGINSAQTVLQTGLKATIGQFAEYERKLNIMQATSSATSAEMARVSQQAKALGNDLSLPGVSAKQAAEAMVELSRAGLSVNDAIGASRGVLQLAIAGQTDTATAARIAAGALNAFGLAGTEAGRVADLLAAASNASMASITDLGLGMSQASAVFRNANQPVEALVTSMAMMSNAGIQGSDAATSLKTAVLALQAPTDKAAGLMKDLGINVRDQQGNMLPLRDIIAVITQRLGALGQAEQDAALKTIFGTDAIRAAQIVLAGGTAGYDKMAASVTQAGKAQELAAAQAKGVAGAWSGFQSQMETLALEVGEGAAPAVEELIKKLAELAKYGETNIRVAVKFALGDLPGMDMNFLEAIGESIERQWKRPTHPLTQYLKLLQVASEYLKQTETDHAKAADTATESTSRITAGWRGNAEVMQKFGLDTLAAAQNLDTATSSADRFKTPLLDAARSALRTAESVQEIPAAVAEAAPQAAQGLSPFQEKLKEIGGDIGKMAKQIDELASAPTGPEMVFTRQMTALETVMANVNAAIISTGDNQNLYKDRAIEAARATGLQGENLNKVISLINDVGRSKATDAQIQADLNKVVEDGSEKLNTFAKAESTSRELAGALGKEMLGLNGSISTLNGTIQSWIAAFMIGMSNLAGDVKAKAADIASSLAGIGSAAQIAGAATSIATREVGAQSIDPKSGARLPLRPGAADGQDYGVVGQFAEGGVVPQTGLALVHKGEIVIPADVAAQVTGANLDMNRALRATNPVLSGTRATTAASASASTGTAATAPAAAAPNPWAGMWSGDFDVSGLSAGTPLKGYLAEIRSIQLETQRLKLVLSQTEPYSAQAAAIEQQIKILDEWRNRIEGQVSYVRLLKEEMEASRTATDHLNKALPRIMQAGSDEKLFGSRGASLLAGVRGFDVDDPKSIVRLAEVGQAYIDGLGEIGEQGAAAFWEAFAAMAENYGPESVNAVMQQMAGMEAQRAAARALTPENVRAATDKALVQARRSGSASVLNVLDPDDPRSLERVGDLNARYIARIEETFDPARAAQLIGQYWTAFETRSEEGFARLDKAIDLLSVDLERLPESARAVVSGMVDRVVGGSSTMQASARDLQKVLSAIPDEFDKWPAAAAGARNSVLETLRLLEENAITPKEAMDRLNRASEAAAKTIQQLEAAARAAAAGLTFAPGKPTANPRPGDASQVLVNAEGIVGLTSTTDPLTGATTYGGDPKAASLMAEILSGNLSSGVAQNLIAQHNASAAWERAGLNNPKAMALGGVLQEPVNGIGKSGQRYRLGEVNEIVMPVADFRRALSMTGMGLPPSLPPSIASVLGPVTDAGGGQSMPGSQNWWQMVFGGPGNLGPGGGAESEPLGTGVYNAWDLLRAGRLGRPRATPDAYHYVERAGVLGDSDTWMHPRTGNAPVNINIYTRERSTARELARTAQRAGNRFLR